MAEPLTCCYLNSSYTKCGNAAEYVIQTVRSIAETPYVGVAGPDMYSDYTHACGDHVGHVLGYQPDAIETEHIYWHVRSLGGRDGE